MSDDGKIDFSELMRLYTEAIESSPLPSIITWQVDKNGVVHLFGHEGRLIGMSDRKGLQYMLDNAPKDKQ